MKIIVSFILVSLLISSAYSQVEDDKYCEEQYVLVGDMHLSFRKTVLNRTIIKVDELLEGNCSNKYKNYYKYIKAQTLRKLDRDSEALELLDESNYIEAEDFFLSFLYSEKCDIYLDSDNKELALENIDIALKLYPSDGFHYIKATVLFESEEYQKTIDEFSKIKYLEEYIYAFHRINAISAYKTDQFKLSENSCNYIIENQPKYSEESINTMKYIQLLIKGKSGELTNEEKEQMRFLIENEIDKRVIPQED